MNESLVGRCGLYCAICEVCRACRDSKRLQEELAARHRCLPEEVRCEGCQTIDRHGWSHEEKWGKNCRILRCLNARNLRFCYECTEYGSCRRFDDFARVCLEGIAIELRRNLQMIREEHVEGLKFRTEFGTDAWLERYPREWQHLAG